MSFNVSLKNVYVWYDNGLKIGRQTPHFNKNWVFLTEPSEITFIGDVPVKVTPLQSQNPNVLSNTPFDPYQLEFDFEKEFERLCDQPHVHSWKEYVGFTDKYEYCEGCDEKRKE